MNRLFILIALVVFCSSCCSMLKSLHPSGRELAKQESDSTVALVYQAELNTHVYCSAVFVSDSVLMTAGHCVNGIVRHLNEDALDELVTPQNVTMQFSLISEITEIGKPTSATHSATVLSLVEDADVALLSIVNPLSMPKHSVVRIADKPPEQGDDVSFMGHPAGFYFTFFRGNIAAIRSDIKFVPTTGPFIQVSAPIYKGNSGGCVFNEDSECLGIASFMSNEAPNTGFYVYTETIRGVLIGAGILKADLTIQPDPEL